jgi:hypothetical protein
LLILQYSIGIASLVNTSFQYCLSIAILAEK